MQKNQLFIITTVVFLLFVGLIRLEAQEFTDRIEFEHLSLEAGLEQSTIHFILQDSRGFLWVGTSAGVSRWDGYEFRNFRPDEADPHSISHHTALCGIEDSEGNIWIGTLLGGLNKYDRKTNRFTRVGGPDSEFPLSHNTIWSLYLQNNEKLWIGTRGGGIDVLDLATGRVENFSSKNSESKPVINYIWEIRPGVGEEIWAATENGVVRFDGSLAEHKLYRLEEYSLAPGVPIRCNSTYPMKNGDVYIGTYGSGVLKYVAAEDRFIQLELKWGDVEFPESSNIQILFVDSRGWLWIGTIKNGCYIYDLSSQALRHLMPDPADPTSLNENKIISFAEDSFGVTWVGTLGGGLNKYSPFRNKFNKILMPEYGQENTYVRSVIEDPLYPGRIYYAGTDGGGLSRIDLEGKMSKVFKNDPEDKNSISDNRIRTLLFDSDHNLWIATGRGVSKLDRDSETFSRILYNPTDENTISGNDIWALCLDSKGYLWVGTEGYGLNKLNLKTGRNRIYDSTVRHDKVMPFENIWYLMEDSRGIIWVGTGGGGLYRYNRIDDSFTAYKPVKGDNSSLSSGEIMSIAEDKNGFLWLGTNGGLHRMDTSSGKFTRIGKEEGLWDLCCYAAVPDDYHHVWATTNHGIFKYDTKSGKIVNFDVSDGLQSNEFNGGAFTVTADGTIMVGGIKGINSFQPGNLIENNIGPMVYITDLTLFNESVETGKEYNGRVVLKEDIIETRDLQLNPEEYIFSLEFTALQFNNPDGINYEYMLEGLHSNWVKTNSEDRKVSFVKLPAREYLLRVRASSSDGVWSESEARIRIHVLPAFYDTIWFRLLVSFLLVAALVSFYLYRTNRIKRRNEELNLINQKLEKEIEERKKIENELRKTSGELQDRLNEIEDLNDDLKAFDYSVSNALRVPLRHISGYADILLENLEKQDTGVLRGYLDRLQESVKTSKQMIDGLLQLSRATSEDLKRETITLEKIVRRVYSQLSREHDLSEFQLEIKDDIQISGDISLLSMAFYNLMENAVKYSKDAALKKIEVGKNDHGEIFIKDYGVGFEQQRISKLFVPFHSYHTDTSFKGVGLGLAISKRIINRHGGIIRAESIKGQGATFYFSL